MIIKETCIAVGWIDSIRKWWSFYAGIFLRFNLNLHIRGAQVSEVLGSESDGNLCVTFICCTLLQGPRIFKKCA